MADLRYRHVSHDRVVLADLEMAQAQFILLVLQRAFHRPTREADVQDDFERRSRMGIAQEVFFLARFENVAGVDEPIGAENLAVALQPKRSAFDFPDGRPLFGVLDVDALPRLAQHGSRIAAERFDIAVNGTRFTAGIAQPAAKIAAHFADVALPQRFQSVQKDRTTGVPFVDREPTEVHAIGQRVPELIEGDVVLGSVNDVVGDARFPTACRIVPAVFGKEQIAVDHGAELRVETGVTEVDADDAVIDLAGVAAPLALNASGLLTGLGMSGIVDDANGLRVGMIAPHDVLHAIANVDAVPGGPIEKLLEGAAWRAVEIRDRLNALAWQIGKLALDVTGQMAARLGTSKAVIKLGEVIRQLRSQRKDLIGGHP